MDAHDPRRERVLVVACRTAAGDALIETVRRRAALSPSDFTLLVPHSTFTASTRSSSRPCPPTSRAGSTSTCRARSPGWACPWHC